MKKILIVSTVSRQFYLFEQGNIEVLKSLGYEIHAAANYSDANNERLDSLGIIRHHFDIDRSPLSLKNFKAYSQLKKIMKSEHFDAVHCHSPMGGVLVRLAAKVLGISTVIYTAHGFHFYKGAPIINWLIYYPVERFLSKYTDFLITINKEDYLRAKKFKAKQVFYVPGIGVDTNKIRQVSINKFKKRQELGIPKDTVVLLSVGEMIKRKNHETALRALARVDNTDFIYLICGRGKLESYLKKLSKEYNIDSKVSFLGYRDDIHEICTIADLFIFPSYQEGLPVSVMEAMASGLPIICSDIRGNNDLIEDGKGGYLINPKDVRGLSYYVKFLIDNPKLRKKMGAYNLSNIKKFDKEVVKESMLAIYKKI
ncbi:glycosyltransferase family 4 protein [Heyndrickxia coagulans]|uniref:glycosyltransferase family 4 protein n=1 Tax=Heyndrickxia coagulans TaxID=1398 RepID=UPI0023E3A5AE|nr:glycosyltransferase family 4 protein [Heyndrickxia coagulans]